MIGAMNLIALEADESSHVAFSTIAELASAICEGHLHAWSQRMLQDAGIELEVNGREHLSAERDYIVMSNHHSQYDIPVLYQALGVPMRMLDTRQIERIPLLAMSKGRQILPVSIEVSRAALSGSRVTPSRRHTATVTISTPIDPAAWGVEKTDRLITVVKSAIERYLPIAPDFIAAESESTIKESGSLGR